MRPHQHLRQLNHGPSDVKVNLIRPGEEQHSVRSAENRTECGGCPEHSRDHGHHSFPHDRRPANLLTQSLDLRVRLILDLGNAARDGSSPFNQRLSFIQRNPDGARSDEEDERLAESARDVPPDESRRVSSSDGEVVVGELSLACRTEGEKKAVKRSQPDGNVVALPIARNRAASAAA